VKLAALYSGGKDSTYAIYRARQAGHAVVCLITMHPAADDSMLFHYPNSWVTRYLAQAMGVPLVAVRVEGRGKEEEAAALGEAVAKARSLHGIEGVVHGGISSIFQKKAFEDVCKKQGLAVVAPLWGADPERHMRELLDGGFSVMIVGVSAMGLGKEWLGKTLDRQALAKLASLSKRYGFNLAFEGGEAETLVTDCPLFSKKLEIKKAREHWDGQRGIFEILEVELIDR
jgi:ABC transporter with metal-binding/Fe-S-binding domain ATP-binding protein